MIKKLELGYALPQRRKMLEDFARSGSKTSHRIYFQQSNQDRPLHKVPLGFPRYRLKNGRTLAAQAEYLAKDPNLPRDLFTRDGEAQEAQEAQHKILLGMVDEKGLVPTLKKQGQREPLIVDSNGFVVNGNRRLCAMRKLHLDKTRDFSSIEIVVLPPATDEEIADLEIALQVAPDVKADYKWYTLGMMLRLQQKQFNHDVGRIAKMFFMKPGEVEKMIAMLLAGEHYLAERTMVGHYHLLDGREYAFRQIVECRKKFGDDETATAAFEQMAYAITDSPEGDRVYAQIPKIHTHFDAIVQSVAKAPATVAIKVAAKPAKSAAKALGGEEKKPDGEVLPRVVAVFQDKTKRAEVTQCVVDAIALQDERQRDQNEAEYVIKRIERAAGALLDAIVGWGKNTKTDGVADGLKTITQHVTELQKKLKA